MLIDGHSTNISREVHKMASVNIIEYQLIPAHSSHIVQPLDLVCFGQINRVWKEAYNSYQQATVNMSLIHENDFA